MTTRLMTCHGGYFRISLRVVTSNKSSLSWWNKRQREKSVGTIRIYYACRRQLVWLKYQLAYARWNLFGETMNEFMDIFAWAECIHGNDIHQLVIVNYPEPVRLLDGAMEFLWIVFVNLSISISTGNRARRITVNSISRLPLWPSIQSFRAILMN